MAIRILYNTRNSQTLSWLKKGVGLRQCKRKSFRMPMNAVLMLGYMNRESLAKTVKTGNVWFTAGARSVSG